VTSSSTKRKKKKRKRGHPIRRCYQNLGKALPFYKKRKVPGGGGKSPPRAPVKRVSSPCKGEERTRPGGKKEGRCRQIAGLWGKIGRTDIPLKEEEKKTINYRCGKKKTKPPSRKQSVHPRRGGEEGHWKNPHCPGLTGPIFSEKKGKRGTGKGLCHGDTWGQPEVFINIEGGPNS